jgi:hypothetical protein
MVTTSKRVATSRSESRLSPQIGVSRGVLPAFGVSRGVLPQIGVTPGVLPAFGVRKQPADIGSKVFTYEA